MLKSLIKMWHEYQERAELRKSCKIILNFTKNKNKKRDNAVYSVLDLLQGCIVKFNSDFVSWQKGMWHHYNNRQKTGAIENAMIIIIELATTVTYLACMLFGCYAVTNYSPIITPEITMKVMMFAYPLCRLHNAMLQRFNYEIMGTQEASEKPSSILDKVFDALWFIGVTACMAGYIYIMPGHFVHFMDLALISCFWFDQIELNDKKDRRIAFLLRISISVFIMATQPTRSVLHFTTEILPIYGRYFLVGITHFTGPSLHYAAQCARQIISWTKKSYFSAFVKPVFRTLFSLLRCLFIPLQVYASGLLYTIYFILMIPTALLTGIVKLFFTAITAANAAKTLHYSLLEKILLTNFTVSYYAIAADKVEYGNLFQKIHIQWPLYCIALWCITPGNGLQYAFLSCAALSGITVLHRFSSDISNEIRKLTPTLLKNPDKNALANSHVETKLYEDYSSAHDRLLFHIVYEYSKTIQSNTKNENTSVDGAGQQKPLGQGGLNRCIPNLHQIIEDINKEALSLRST